MTTIVAEGVEINIENDYWRLFNATGPNSLMPFFHTFRGDGLLHYTAVFGEMRGLPGDVLAVDYVKAVVVGYDERRSRWTLGLHVAMSDTDKPRFAELVHWPAEQNPQYAIDSHTAGRVLAEYLSCPLRLFGVKKVAQAPGGVDARATVTGPLVPHERIDMKESEVQLNARDVILPISLGGLWLGAVGTTNVTLRLPREAADKSQGEVPAYNQCVFDKNTRTVRLIPPTGLLGAFFGAQGRIIKFEHIRNVELRHTLTHESSMAKDETGMAVDVTYTTHLFNVFLTLADESLMLLRLSHKTSSELRRRRFKIQPPTQRSTEGREEDMKFLQEHQEDQRQFDQVNNFAGWAALVIAATTSRPLVKTTVGTEF
jgi:hypothetical protein